MSKLRDWDAANYLEDEEDRELYLQIMSQENNEILISHAKDVVERSRKIFKN